MIAWADEEKLVFIRIFCSQCDCGRAVALAGLEDDGGSFRSKASKIGFLGLVCDDDRRSELLAKSIERLFEKAAFAKQRQQVLGPSTGRERP